MTTNEYFISVAVYSAKPGVAALRSREVLHE